MGNGTMRCRIAIAPVLAGDTDEVVSYVLAHELSHAILRHAQLSLHLTVNAVLCNATDDLTLDAMHAVTETAATLQALLWGFTESYAAFLAAHPGGFRLRGW